MNTKNIAWIVYTFFVLLAIFNNGDEHPFIGSGPFPAGKYLIWLFFLGFTAYTYHVVEMKICFAPLK